MVEVAGSAEQVVETHRLQPRAFSPSRMRGSAATTTERSAVIRPSSPSWRRMIEPGRAQRSTRLATSAGSFVAQSPADTLHVTVVMPRSCTARLTKGVRWPWGGR